MNLSSIHRRIPSVLARYEFRLSSRLSIQCSSWTFQVIQLFEVHDAEAPAATRFLISSQASGSISSDGCGRPHRKHRWSRIICTAGSSLASCPASSIAPTSARATPRGLHAPCSQISIASWYRFITHLSSYSALRTPSRTVPCLVPRSEISVRRSLPLRSLHR